MAIIVKGKKPKGCYDCDNCDKRAYFDGNEWHLGCRLLCKEVSDDGETDEMCPIVGEIPDRHGRLIDAYRLATAVAQAQDSVLHKEYDPFMLLGDVLRWIGLAPTIVEASDE